MKIYISKLKFIYFWNFSDDFHSTLTTILNCYSNCTKNSPQEKINLHNKAIVGKMIPEEDPTGPMSQTELNQKLFFFEKISLKKTRLAYICVHD